jgi:hypothetical protein
MKEPEQNTADRHISLSLLLVLFYGHSAGAESESGSEA